MRQGFVRVVSGVLSLFFLASCLFFVFNGGARALIVWSGLFLGVILGVHAATGWSLLRPWALRTRERREAFRRQASDLVHQRLEVVLALSDDVLLGLPKSSTEELVLAGVKARCSTIHFKRKDGAHWVVVELWQGGMVSYIWAQEGIALSGHTRRPLTAQELCEGL